MSSIEEKMVAALAHKDLGNESFKTGDLKNALMQYHLAVLGLSGLDNQMSGMPMMSSKRPQEGAATEAQKSDIKAALAVVYSNMGACHLKNANYKRAIEVCNTALKNDPDNVKAKFRRAQAKLGEGNLAGAESDLLSLGEKVPGVKAELDKLKKMSKAADEKQRKSMGGFLSRGRIISTEEEEEEGEGSASASTGASGQSGSTSAAKTPKSKPTLASKLSQGNQTKKPKAAPKEEEYHATSTWSGTAPKIQELADGEE
ncbi:hypothetical protein KVV02_002620 [Mortierella alpina]|uniref:TPR-like protein n=1 Tax=Mortierella alpina TaxID=64518 RepID=A0A9P8A7J4_MORAP|nr:hypothetical protein KVV02_002620 [Mortierella alpina]